MLEEYTYDEKSNNRTDTLLKAIERIRLLEVENTKLKNALAIIKKTTYDRDVAIIAKECLND